MSHTRASDDTSAYTLVNEPNELNEPNEPNEPDDEPDEEPLEPFIREPLPYESVINNESNPIEPGVSTSATIQQELKNTENIADVPIEPTFTIENIKDYLQPVDDNQEIRKNTMIRLVKMGLSDMENVSGRHNRVIVAKLLMNIVASHLDILHLPGIEKFALTVKAKMNELISRERIYALIPIYNIIFNDNAYDNIEIQPDESIITQQEIDEYIHQYNNNLVIYSEQQAKAKPLPLYEKDEIVGAKDKEGNWWMSKILEVFHHKSHNMYYVEFLGWGDRFNEFITNSYRLKRFNPRVHKYYRPAWRKAQIAKLEKTEAVDLVESIETVKTIKKYIKEIPDNSPKQTHLPKLNNQLK